MTALVHATLQRLTVTAQPGKDQPPLVKEAEDSRPLEVQFNPATLRISRNNNVDRGGTTTRNQKVQHPAQEGSTLTFDLEFDTAEQRGGGQYVDVRRWTALVRQFVEPPAKTSDPPPAVRFVWGTLRYNGIVTQVNEELDHFAPDGTPLRAKVGVTIVEQNFAYQAHAEGPATRDARTATEAGDQRTGAAPGTSGTNRPRQVVQAQDGESAQQLLSRLGLDPAAWRGAMSGLDSPLTLAAGASVQLGAEVSAGFAAAAGISLSAGFAGDAAPTSVGGLAAALGTGGGPGADPALAGFVLSAGGGIAASADIVAGAAVDCATSRARQSFEVPAAAAAGPPGGAVPAGSPVREPARPGPAGYAPPQVPDRRSLGYGRGIPLRARADPGTLAEVRAGGGRSLADRARREEIAPPDPGAAPWERLPAAAPGRAAADCEQRGRDAGRTTLRWTPRGGPP
ncbi:CIS tube protein [Streptomyces sp. NBC_00354]|uniref:CIS tube protein n=1 Tax=Streptomyces sp. NBC_00354 TaxID=2975723 RepID=UPI002E276C35